MKAPKPKTPIVKPPRAKRWEADYKLRVTGLWRSWSDHVIHAAQVAMHGRADGTRTDGLDDELRATFGTLLDALGLEKFLGRAAAGMTKQQAAYVQRVAKVPISSAGSQVEAEAWRQKNLALIKRLSAQQVQEVADIVRPAQAQGLRFEDIAKQVQERLQIGARHARLIARDQTNKFNGDAQKATQTRAGITQFKWSTANDEAVRGRPGGEYAKSKDNHWALHNTIHAWSDPPIIPGTTRRALPGQDVQCRCVGIPIVPWL